MLVKVQLHGPTITDEPSPRKTEIDFRKRLVPEETYVKLEGFIWVQSQDLPESLPPDDPIPPVAYKKNEVFVQTEDRKKTYKAFGLWTPGAGVVCIDVLRRVKIEGERECSS